MIANQAHRAYNIIDDISSCPIRTALRPCRYYWRLVHDDPCDPLRRGQGSSRTCRRMHMLRCIRPCLRKVLRRSMSSAYFAKRYQLIRDSFYSIALRRCRQFRQKHKPSARHAPSALRSGVALIAFQHQPTEKIMRQFLLTALFAVFAVTATAHAAQACCDSIVCCDGSECCE